MTIELQGPSKTQIKEYIMSKTVLEIKLINGETITGKIEWRDESAMLVSGEDDRKFTVFNSAIIYICPKND